jgi:hypothetical protein
MPDPRPAKVHISLFLTLVSFFSKLTATHKNTKVKEELLAACVKRRKFGKEMCALAQEEKT